ncbi:MAG: ATP-binding cassette domain-containing protein [Anaerolineales bacterium]|nr:ATP-binding cassette domain-containing protein [Anaerolineales bacterium]
MSEPLIRVQDLSLSFPNEDERFLILDSVTFDIYPHEVLGLVGESGSGKTVTSLAVIQLLPKTAKVECGEIWFDGRDLLNLSEGELREIRGCEIAMIFQSPRAALNPLMRAGDQVARAYRLRHDISKKESQETAVELLRHVGISDAKARARAYPHQLSGGMAQRVLVAMMLACRPRLLIADEPTTGLDVTIQAQIFELIKEVQNEIGTTLLLITHDLGVVSEMCQRVAVMYAGQVMEIAPVNDLFSKPQHPYTEMLLGSVLRVDQLADLDTMQEIPSVTINYATLGCRFADRCEDVRPVCWQTRPSEFELSLGHVTFCHKYSEAN